MSALSAGVQLPGSAPGSGVGCSAPGPRAERSDHVIPGVGILAEAFFDTQGIGI